MAVETPLEPECLRTILVVESTRWIYHRHFNVELMVVSHLVCFNLPVLCQFGIDAVRLELRCSLWSLYQARAPCSDFLHAGT
eukprot:1730625-Amphidinium_carterae.1